MKYLVREMDNLFVEYEFVHFGSCLFAWQINFSWKTRFYSLTFSQKVSFVICTMERKPKWTSFEIRYWILLWSSRCSQWKSNASREEGNFLWRQTAKRIVCGFRFHTILTINNFHQLISLWIKSISYALNCVVCYYMYFCCVYNGLFA